ncbi:nucleolar protein dao-5-like [Sycon ciliatum]|uniref:nucleolar protein dao-5-like n=1 Tax=Sycon ciliatum TaxID=27933 RepID=UPI0031F6D248
MFKKRASTKQGKTPIVAVPSSPGVAAVPGSSIPVSQEELTLANSEFNVHKITDIQNRFHGGEELLVAGRIFVREGTLLKVCRKGPKPRQFFLFNDILIYGTILPTKGRYAQQHILDLEHMTVTSDCHFMPSVYTAHSTELDVDSENAFQINHMEKSFHVFASSLADKANWIHNLKKYIAKRTMGKNDQGNFAMKAVWVPDARVNHCMGCEVKFTTFNRKHHCRFCGKVVCNDCSPHRVDVSALRGAEKPNGKMERVCKECFHLSQSDPHKGKSPPTSPAASPRSSMRTSKPTVIDSRSGTTPEAESVLAQAGFTASTDGGAEEEKKNKRPAPARPPPPSSPAPAELVEKAKERRLRIDSGTFDRPRSKMSYKERGDTGTAGEAVEEGEEQNVDMYDEDVINEGEEQYVGRSDSSSDDSDDSAEIDLDDVEERDPFTMQRANSESPLHGSLTDEGLGEMCHKIGSNIRLSSIDVMATDGELHSIMMQSVPDIDRRVNVECGKCSKVCTGGEYGCLRSEFLCKEHFFDLVRDSSRVDTSTASKPATRAEPKPAGRQAPVRPARPRQDNAVSPDTAGQPMKPKPRQRMATNTADGQASSTPATTAAAAAEEQLEKTEAATVTTPTAGTTASSTANTMDDVDRLLTMTPEEQKPGAASSMLVSLATDPPGLSAEPLVPVPTAAASAMAADDKAAATPPSAKRQTERRRKKFKSATPAGGANAETSPTSPADTPAHKTTEEEHPASIAEDVSFMREDTDSLGDTGMAAAGSGNAVSPDDSSTGQAVSSPDPATTPGSDSTAEVPTGDLLDFGDDDKDATQKAGNGAAVVAAASGKAQSRAEKRKNKFKKKDAS